MRKISKEDLIWRLICLNEHDYAEDAHIRADEALLRYIGSKEVYKLFLRIEKWYA